MSGRSDDTRRSSQPRRDNGAAAVEFALVVPILAMLLMGLVTGGLAYTNSIGLTNAVREGARFGAIAPSNSDWGKAAIQRTMDAQADDFSSGTTFCARLLKNTSGATAVPSAADKLWEKSYKTAWSDTCPLAGAPVAPAVDDGQCVAMVWAVRPFEITAVVFQGGGNIQRGSVARYEGTC